MIKNAKQQTVNQKSLDIFSYTEQTIHLFDRFMTEQYILNHTVEDLYDNLARFYDGLIWAQKKNPLLVYQMFQMKALNQIIQKYIDINTIVLMKNTILLFSNCQPHGLVAQQMVQHKYPHFFLSNLFKENLITKLAQEIQQNMGVFLKSYNKLFKAQWLNKFIIENQYFELLEINIKYYNCQDFMARTNSLNIVLDLLKYKQVRSFIEQCKQRKMFYQQYFDRMTKLFRNELAQFGLRIAHISKQDNVEYILTQLEDKIAMWVDLAINYIDEEQCILQKHFWNNVILPLIIGPIQVEQVPLFSLKFSLFVIKKLISIMKSLHLLQFYIRVIFFEEKVSYYLASLRKAIIEPFLIKNLTSKQITQSEPDQRLDQNNIKQFYQNFIKSKDNHFILMKNSWLTSLFKQGQSCSYISTQYGLHYGGDLYYKICKNLLVQINDIHQLNTIQSILTTLILINNGKSLETELQNQYIQACKHLIFQLKSGLNWNLDPSLNNNIIFLAEIVQYDVKFAETVKLGAEKSHEKFENIFKVVFVWEIKKQQLNKPQFYFRVPDSPTQYIRYLFIKFLLVRKARILLVDGSVVDDLLQHYYQKMVLQCSYLTGDLYKQFQIQQQIQSCQLVKQKDKHKQIAYIIKDKNFFVMGKQNGERIQICHGIKYKHVSVQENKKKKIIIRINQFSDQTKQIAEITVLELKWDENICLHIKKCNKQSIHKNLQFIQQCLQRTLSQLPAVSLI